MREFFELVTLASVASSALFGAMIGAFYGYTLRQEGRHIYPFTLWAVGLGFIVVLGIFTVTTDLTTTPAYSVGRAALWTLTCAAIPVGRWLRMRFEEWRVSRGVER